MCIGIAAAYTGRVINAGVGMMEDTAHRAVAHGPVRSSLVRWAIAGLLLLVGIGAMSLLSGRLSPLQPAPQRPLHLFVICYMVSWVGFAIAYRLISANPAKSPMWLILGIALLARVMFLPSELIQSDDCYRYILDGQSILQGINPFRFTPQEVQANPPPELLARFPDKARHVISHVNNAQVPTIYPPLALAVFAAGAALTPWQIAGQRWMFMLCDLATVVLLVGLLHRHNKPLGWIVLYAWNPLVIKEISNTAHVDSLVGLWLVVLIAALTISASVPPAACLRSGLRLAGRRPAGRRTLPSRQCHPLGWSVLVGLAAGGAILAKLYPLILLPCCVAYVSRGRRSLVPMFIGIVAMLITVALVVALCYWPFMGVGYQRVTAGLRSYSEHWINNPGAFVLLEWLFDSPRKASAAAVALVALLAAVRLWRSHRRADHLVHAMQTTLLAWFLFAPTCLPWYVVGLLAISVLRPRGWCVVLTGSLGLFYLLRYFDGQDQPAGWQHGVQLVEHGAVWIWLAGTALKQVFAIKDGPR